MKTCSTKRELYSRKIDFFFRRPATETALIVLISASIPVAAHPLFDDDH